MPDGRLKPMHYLSRTLPPIPLSPAFPSRQALPDSSSCSKGRTRGERVTSLASLLSSQHLHSRLQSLASHPPDRLAGSTSHSASPSPPAATTEAHGSRC